MPRTVFLVGAYSRKLADSGLTCIESDRARGAICCMEKLHLTASHSIVAARTTANTLPESQHSLSDSESMCDWIARRSLKFGMSAISSFLTQCPIGVSESTAEELHGCNFGLTGS